MNMASLFTDQNFLIAKAVCMNQSKNTSDLALFNKLFRELLKMISHDYFIADAKDGLSSSPRYKIYMPIEKSNEITDEEISNTKKELTEVSVGEFILETLKKWNPEKSKYLTYVDRLLKDYEYRYPSWVTQDQAKFEYQIKKVLIPTLKRKTGLKQIEWSDLPKYIREYLPDYPNENLFLIENIINQVFELDKTLEESEDATYLDMIGDSPKTQNFDKFETLEDLIARLYSIFKREQLRTKNLISVYITVYVYSSLFENNEMKELNKLSKKYPDMINSSYFDWIREFYEKKRKEYDTEIGPDFNKSTLFPSRNDQAEKIGKEYYSYSMVISRFIKKLEEKKLKDPFLNLLYNH